MITCRREQPALGNEACGISIHLGTSTQSYIIILHQWKHSYFMARWCASWWHTTRGYKLFPDTTHGSLLHLRHYWDILCYCMPLFQRNLSEQKVRITVPTTLTLKWFFFISLQIDSPHKPQPELSCNHRGNHNLLVRVYILLYSSRSTQLSGYWVQCK